METWKEFDANELTHSAAHHLLAIHELGQQYGGWARVTDIAQRLGITRGSVSISLRPLKSRGLLLEDDHHMVKLSPEGQNIVNSVLAKRRAIQIFLSDVLGLTPSQADVDSCKIEHLVSPEATGRLVEFMQFLTSDDPDARGVLERFRQYKADCTSDGGCPVCRGNCLLVQLAPTKEA